MLSTSVPGSLGDPNSVGLVGGATQEPPQGPLTAGGASPTPTQGPVEDAVSTDPAVDDSEDAKKAEEKVAAAKKAEDDSQKAEEEADAAEKELPPTQGRRTYTPKKRGADVPAGEVMAKLLSLGQDTNNKVTDLSSRVLGVESTVDAIKEKQEDLEARLTKIEHGKPTPSLASMPTVSITTASSSAGSASAKLLAKVEETLDNVNAMKKLQLVKVTQDSLPHAVRKSHPKAAELIRVMEMEVTANEDLSTETVGGTRTAAKLELTTVIAATLKQGDHPDLCAIAEKHMKEMVVSATAPRMDLVVGPWANAVQGLLKLPTLHAMTHIYAYESLLQATLIQAASKDVALGDNLLHDEEYMKEVRNAFAPTTTVVAPVTTVSKKKHEALEKKVQDVADRAAERETENAELRAENTKVTKENNELQKGKVKVQTELNKTKTELSSAKDSLSAAVAAQNPAPGQK